MRSKYSSGMRCNVMNFQILIDDTFINTCGDVLSPSNNKSILSLVNDFEDGKWRYKNFHLFIWDNIAETSLSSKERAALIDCSASLISAAAENLRLVDKENDISKGSELAEIMLYGIMKHHYGALPIVPKIFINKTHKIMLKVPIVYIWYCMVMMILLYGLVRLNFIILLRMPD